MPDAFFPPLPDSAFLHVEFFALIACSLLLPVGIYGFLLLRRAISWRTVLVLAVLLIALSGVDVVLLQNLAEAARHTSSRLDDQWFTAELSLAMYLLPAVFAGIGVNLASHVLISHLRRAERLFEQGRARGKATGTVGRG